MNGLSRLTKLTTSNGQAWPIRFENFQISPSLSNRIESGGRFEFESNLEASQVPSSNGVLLMLTSTVDSEKQCGNRCNEERQQLWGHFCVAIKWL